MHWKTITVQPEDPANNGGPAPNNGGPWRNILANPEHAIPSDFDIQNVTSAKEHEGDQMIVQIGSDPNTPPAADNFDGERVACLLKSQMTGETVVWVRGILCRPVKVQILEVA